MAKRGRSGRALLAVVLAVGMASSLGACADAQATDRNHGVIQVVTAESFWGSIAAQLGGEHAAVTSIVVNPDADPHDYEPTTRDSRYLASADMVVINGLGYDTWATKVVAANPNPAQTVLTVGDALDLPDGSNPHRWYNPDDVFAIARIMTRDYQRVDPADTGYFAQQLTDFLTMRTADYRAAIARINATYAGTKVGASESIFAMLAPSLGLNLITPASFLRDISEGSEPTAQDKSTIDAQITQRQIAVYVYNSQNATPDIQRQIESARANSIPVTTITETLTPEGTSWQAWQTAQLRALESALAESRATR